MYRSEHQAFLFFSKNYDAAITVVFMELYHWGTLDWNGHKAGDWFFKSISDISAELGISTKPVRKAYDIIKRGECHFFESKIERRKNYPITYFRVISKESHHVPEVHSKESHHVPEVHSKESHHVPEVHSKESHHVPEVHSKESHHVPEVHSKESHHVPEVHSKESHHVPEVPAPCTSGTQYHVPQVHGINILTHNNCMYTEPTLSSKIPLTKNPERQTDDPLKMIEIWNELIQPSKLESISQSLEKRCREILAAHFDSDIGQWGKYCSMIASSSFLMGETFTLTLGWALKPEWIQKVLNGGYDDHEWRKENDMARKKAPVRLGSITLEDVLADCKNETDRKIKPPLYHQLGAETYASWIHRTGAAFYLEGNQLCVNSCGVFVQSQIKQRFWDKIEKIYNNSYAEMKKGENAYVS